MGSCSSNQDYNTFSKKVIRINQKVAQSSDEIVKGTIQYYDVEYKEGKQFQIKLFPFTDLSKISQLSIDSSLYILGQQSDSNFSYFMKYDLFSPSIGQFSLLPNSIFPHVQPSLLYFKNEFIIAVGGKGSISCEIYSLKSNTWKELPSLLEERYGCSLYGDEVNEILYCFGGMIQNESKEKAIFYGTIKKLDLKKNAFWETIMTKDFSLLERSFSSIVKKDTFSIYIIGGCSKFKSLTDEIIEYSFVSSEAKAVNLSLFTGSIFDLYSYCVYNNKVYLMDYESVIHQINFTEEKTDVLQYFDVKEYESNDNMSQSLYENRIREN